jgi:hypothetical protein
MPPLVTLWQWRRRAGSLIVAGRNSENVSTLVLLVYQVAVTESFAAGRG